MFIAKSKEFGTLPNLPWVDGSGAPAPLSLRRESTCMNSHPRRSFDGTKEPRRPGWRIRRPTTMYHQSPWRHGDGSRKPFTSMPGGGAASTGVGNFDHPRNWGTFDMAMHCVSRRGGLPVLDGGLISRNSANARIEHHNLAVLSTAAVPVKQPSASGPPGVGARATGRCFQ